MIHYFKHGSNYEAVEDPEQAAKYAAAGWQRVTCDAFVKAWRERDLVRLDQLAALPPIKMATPKSGDVIERLPNGYVRFHV